MQGFYCVRAPAFKDTSMLKAHIEVKGNVWRGVLVDGQGRARVLDEEVGHAYFKALQLLHLPDNVPGDDVAPPVHAWQRHCLL